MSECIACMKSVAPDSPSLKCSECKNRYHTGKCSGVTKNALKAMPQGNLEEWVCNTCKVHSSRQLASSQESPSTGEGQLAQQSLQGTNFERVIKQNEVIGQRLSDVLVRLQAVERCLEIQTNKGEYMLPKHHNQGKTVEGIETSLNSLSTQQDEILSRLGSLEKTIHALQKKTSELEGKIFKRDAEIKELKTAVDKAEQYSRRETAS